jgi:hypothetical protein
VRSRNPGPSLAGLLLLFLLIAQFIAYFNLTNIPDVMAVKLGDILEHLNIGAVWLLIGVIAISMAANFILPQAIAKWAILAPIFVPLFMRLGVAPQTVLAAFRVGDSPTNVISPLMAYFPLTAVFAQRYRKDAGVGTVISLMLPYVVVLSIAWPLFFVAWYLLGIPLGPGSPVRTWEGFSIRSAKAAAAPNTADLQSASSGECEDEPDKERGIWASCNGLSSTRKTPRRAVEPVACVRSPSPARSRRRLGSSHVERPAGSPIRAAGS